jgi:hypothetical protein
MELGAVVGTSIDFRSGATSRAQARRTKYQRLRHEAKPLIGQSEFLARMSHDRTPLNVLAG